LLKILAGIGALLMLLVIVAAIAIHTVDINDFVGPIQARVKEATGRDLTIRGGISLKLSLEPKLVIEDVSLGNAPWGKAPQMLTAKRIEAQMRLLPLLRRRFEIDRFKLIEPTITLETDGAGKGNWDFAKTAGASQPPSPSSTGGVMSALAVGDLAIENGTLTYRDGKSGALTNVVIESLSLHARDFQSSVNAQFRGRIADIAVALEGDLGPVEALVQHRWPYPISMQGEINSQKSAITTKLSVDDAALTLDELNVAMGTNKAIGKIVISRGGTRPHYSITISAPTLAMADLALPFIGGRATPSSAPTRKPFFERPLDLEWLQAMDADVTLNVGALTLTSGRRLDNLRLQATASNGRLDAQVLEVGVFGGKVQGKMTLDATRASDSAVTLHATANGLDLGTLLDAFGTKREVRGGKTQITADLSAHGASPQRWVEDMSGTLTAVVGPATLGKAGLDRSATLNRLGEAVDPFHDIDPSTELTCAVVRLPLKNGIAHVNNSIALETKKLGAAASGTLDFRTDTLDLAIKPQIRQGIRIDIAQIAQLVHLKGPFSAPRVAIDAVGTAATVARLGAAISTGGLSILGESLLVAATDAGGSLCQVALGAGDKRSSTKAATAAAQATSPANSIGTAIEKIFRR
jgi:AsmA family protein